MHSVTAETYPRHDQHYTNHDNGTQWLFVQVPQYATQITLDTLPFDGWAQLVYLVPDSGFMGDLQEQRLRLPDGQYEMCGMVCDAEPAVTKLLGHGDDLEYLMKDSGLTDKTAVLMRVI